jgi:hypothetical protein
MKREERLAREMANKDRYFPSRGVPEPRLVPSSASMGGTIAVLGPKGTTSHDLLLMVRVVLQGDVWVEGPIRRPERGD